ncbi:aminotransferase class III-fold pyridoxal phosphate-dependent enzyme [Candidatus Leptofilum sp.]|uniref:aminotransferase class III-fold pyridoxal phosphate-dependent enzyme n=1 Tax=Candidatus Leptofilum sp. TaxID=3241576 RepID=UPI003B59835B
MVKHVELARRNKQFTLTSWQTQNGWRPVSMARADDVYFWDANGKRYLDWSSQLVNVNIGHNNQQVIEAIQAQAAKLTYAMPSLATEPRARLGELLAEITPDGLTKSFFTLGGADAIENAMKIARLVTGRQKILTRYRAYHGGTFGAMSAGGDPRRLANEPGVPWIVRLHDPYAYRSPLYDGRTRDEGDQALIDQMAETIEYEGADNIAAVLLEGYSGTSGIIQGEEVYWRGVQQLCDQYGLLLIIDEVMSGYGRTGKWFGVNHYPWVKPDIIVMAKGLTSGYVPLGAVVVSEQIAAHFEENVLWAGLTYSAHALACAAAIANIQVYRQQDLIERSAKMGQVLRAGLVALAEKHPSVGDIRGTGLHQVIELVKNRDSREPFSPFNQPMTEPMQKVAALLLANGMSTFVKWNWIFCTPPLIINEAQIEEGLSIIDKALMLADAYTEG